ncbi:unnamed protein product [Malassezia sympodialis ATCC 42132]|uniref:Synaptobrevin homolog YKT6 n=1 Tax=Malassezia sympodialis (strain ATCC 42132) TaxID=1230383 RepID=M5ECD0_MALS4|nr:uncharacterized protein MSY001_2769 [Malassezia sympodialis ATCC 42132]CCV00064.1 unnamed protein product [Malassezia sympodialis ATCC 42132]SHO79981.1 Similar to S.cerevisiae protein NYV1 (v-SNARE component of the vacuolar SNARE complex) [Malassezia sympodialis ATCC 42132]|eukprot:XP_018741276.1 uncharacterized protein MSY001_2769 [Malassezia sympodialis ATCC 42132]
MLVLALVARGSDVLVESHDPEHERFLTAATAILAKIDPATAPRLSYAYEQWLFHYMADDDGLVFLAVADAAMGRRVPFAFLAEMQKAYRATPGAPGAFQAPLDALRRECHADPDADPIKRAQTELGSVKDVITRNVEQILSRGEQIELLMDRTDSAASQSLAFRRRAVSLRREMWWRNTRILALVGVCALALLLFLYHALFS